MYFHDKDGEWCKVEYTLDGRGVTLDEKLDTLKHQKYLKGYFEKELKELGMVVRGAILSLAVDNKTTAGDNNAA